MKVLVTGAAGFVGSHLSERLRSLSHDVVGLDNFSPYYDPATKRQTAALLSGQGIDVLTLDLRQPSDLERLPTDFDYIFHLAAQSGISETSTFEDYLFNNVVATKNLIDFALRNSSLKLFVNISTSSVYGLDACQDESFPAQPVSFYGVTKLAAEQLVLSQSRENRFRAVSLRLYSVYGPRERPEKLYPKLMHAAFSGAPFPLFEGGEKHLRSFTYVGDAVMGIASVLGREEAVDGEVINIGSDLQNSTLDGIRTVERLCGHKISIDNVPKRSGDQLRTYAMIGKARRLLGYDPKTTLEEGLKIQIAHFLAGHQTDLAQDRKSA